MKTAARRTGHTVDEYRAQLSAGQRYCYRCRAWHPVEDFGPDQSRSDGLARQCRAAKARVARGGRLANSVQPPRRFVDARDEDRLQARRRVNYLVETGALRNPNRVACADCGHLGTERRHEYDHHLGYAAEHHEDVEPVCAPCHHAREADRRHVA